MILVRILSALLVIGGMSCGRYEVTDKEKDPDLRREENPSGATGPQGPVGPAGPAGERGTPGDPGGKGSDGKDGSNGTSGHSIVHLPLEVSGIDRNLSWSTSNYIIPGREGVVEIPYQFILGALPSTGSPQGGWIDLVVGVEVYCYQRISNSRTYQLMYKKQVGAVQGCDSNSEKESGAFRLTAELHPGTVIRVIPRDPKLSGVYWDMELIAQVQE